MGKTVWRETIKPPKYTISEKHDSTLETIAMLCKKNGFFFAVTKRHKMWYVFNPRPRKILSINDHIDDGILFFQRES